MFRDRAGEGVVITGPAFGPGASFSARPDTSRTVLLENLSLLSATQRTIEHMFVKGLQVRDGRSKSADGTSQRS
jgi:hypothetical protein